MRMWSTLRSVAVGAVLVHGLAACANDSLQPDGLPLRVTIVDDSGAPVDRTVFTVSEAGVPIASSRTNAKGEATVSVPAAGAYEVLVTPRTGYIAGVPSLRKQITVDGAIDVQFVVYRGASTEDHFLPCRECRPGN